MPTLGDVNRLCFPAFLLDRQVSGQDHLRKSPSDNPHNSSLCYQAHLCFMEKQYRTEASYSSCWRVWVNWCSKQGVNPINTSVEKIINKDKQYSTLNSYRSSISVTHMPVDGV